ncbi:hypothetical protein P7D22_17010 [Lichenihabitans sp. Uapishka_5]|uniref:hypothetical protein n=1 Tax=Lichenihabitans sp. Uapishka_5 TaxID=3037302 RepID=UPI0029E7E32D|nr:hypothetical protein [Lichenihabitans sp. Uapishka_5]MDX7952868.1 hypothetical protein [Lichenihabitans sp. Uapishka_5]
MSDGYRPEPQHVSRVAVRLAEQLQAYHDPDWDFRDPVNRLLVWRAASRVAEAEGREIAAILQRGVQP